LLDFAAVVVVVVAAVEEKEKEKKKRETRSQKQTLRGIGMCSVLILTKPKTHCTHTHIPHIKYVCGNSNRGLIIVIAEALSVKRRGRTKSI
jgi:hypothetical protein